MTTLDTRTRLTGDTAEQAWKLYYECFAPLAILAVQRHVMTHEEFIDVAEDERVDKVLTYDPDGKLIGVATFTRDLEAVPLVSVAYFEHHWPELVAGRRIWYLGFVAVAGNGKLPAAFMEPFAHYFNEAAREHGMVGLDICAWNEDTKRLPQIIGANVKRLASRHGATGKFKLLDSQRYWLYDMLGEHL